MIGETMTTAELQQIALDDAASEEDIADSLYGAARDALIRGEPRRDVLAALQTLHEQLSGDQQETPRRAVREVLACFDGYCAPGLEL